MNLSEIQKIAFNQVNNKGFYLRWNRARLILEYHHSNNDIPESFDKKQSYLIDLAEMGLMHTEISEAMEEIRNGNREKAVIELAGCVVRVLCYCENQKFDLEKYILSELERNKKRELYHGRIVI